MITFDAQEFLRIGAAIYDRRDQIESMADAAVARGFDNIVLLQNLKEEIREHRNLVVVIDGIDHLKVADHADLSDIHERRSSVILDLYKALDIPMFLGGELIDSEKGLVGPRAYLRDSDAIYWLESKGGNLFLTVNSKRLGSNKLYRGTLSIDPDSNRMQEA